MQLSVNMCGLEYSGEMFLCIYLGSPKFREVHRSSCSKQGPEHKSGSLPDSISILLHNSRQLTLLSRPLLLPSVKWKQSEKLLEDLPAWDSMPQGRSYTRAWMGLFLVLRMCKPRNTMNLASCAKGKQSCLNRKVLRITWTEMCGRMTGNKAKTVYSFSPHCLTRYGSRVYGLKTGLSKSQIQ